MSNEELRNLTQNLANSAKEGSIIFSIPESAGPFGDMQALQMIGVAKERLPQSENPMRATSAGASGIMVFVYADGKRLFSDSEYFEKFIRMSTELGTTVQDVFCFN